LLGSLIATLINQVFSPQELLDFAWRWPFLLGGVFGLLAVYLRRWLAETPVFAELQQRRALAEELPLKTVLRDHRSAVVLSMLLTWVLSAAIVVLILMTPSVLQSAFGFAPALTLQANSLAIVCLSFGCIAAGLLADRFGAGRVLMFGSLLLASLTWSFYSNLAARPDLLLPLYAATGLAVGMIGAIPLVLVKAFPAAVRFSGLSFSYNLAYAIFGGLTPMTVAFLLKYSTLGPAYYVVALCVLGLAIGLYLRRGERLV
jgi:MFS family permease